MQTRPGQAAPPSPERVVGGGRVLPKPVDVVARGILRGVALSVPVPPVNVNRWAGTEVHISESPSFTPSGATLAAAGKETHFEITAGLEARKTYYLRAMYVDLKGGRSLPSDEVSAVAGGIETSDLAPQSISDIVVHSASSVVSRTSTSYADMPDTNQSYVVTEPGTLLIMVVAPAIGVYGFPSIGAFCYPRTRLLINDEIAEEDPQPPGSWTNDGFIWAMVPGSYYRKIIFTEADTYPQVINVKLQWRVWATSGTAGADIIRNTRRSVSFVFLKR